MLTLYGIPNCSSVKKARALLDEKKISHEFHDFKKRGITEAQLHAWVKKFGWQKLVNKQGTTWRGLPEDVKSVVQDDKSAIALMKENPSVIKRPVVVKSGAPVLLGFEEAAYLSYF